MPPDRPTSKGALDQIKCDPREGKRLREVFESREDLVYQELYELWKNGRTTSDFVTGSHIRTINGEGEEV